ncbi:MAG TPA: hypothetical protein VG838_03505 [Opitutaceae bacterium]|nr:hypothetical protein [Opitutaceae bacterium]
MGLTACSEQGADRAAMDMVQYLPLAVVVPKGEEMRRAEEYAGRQPHLTAFWGVSPRPLAYYGDHAGLVVKEVDFSELRRGMTVIYVNPLGVRVGGLLVRGEPAGWVVKDWGAPETKPTPVTARTLVGVVLVAFVAPDPKSGSGSPESFPEKAVNFP